MTCPVCGGKNKVVGTKTDCESIHRKRVCEECGYVFYTAEYDAPSSAEYDALMAQYSKEREMRKNDK